MATPQDTDFTRFAGQLVKDGVGKNAPMIALENGIDPTTIANLELIQGLMPTKTDIFIRPTKIFGNPLDPIITRRTSTYGAFLETAEFVDGTSNKKRDCSCVPKGSQVMGVQLDAINYSHNINVHIYDREINKAVLNAAQAGAYTAEKMKLPAKTAGTMKYRAIVQLLSNPIDGTRSIPSFTHSSGGGVAMVYNPTNIKGWAGAVEYDPALIVPAIQPAGVSPTIGTPDIALSIYKTLKDVASDFGFESTEFNHLGINGFVSGKPALIMEAKVLNAMDNIFSLNANYKGIPTVSAREALGAFASIYEIDSFAALPTNSAYTGAGQIAALLDPTAITETVFYNSAESARCAQERYTGWNYQYESIMSIFRGANGFSLIGARA